MFVLKKLAFGAYLVWFATFQVTELKQELKKRGLSVDGKKSDLIERLQTSIGDSALLDDTHDDLLDDDDLSVG